MVFNSLVFLVFFGVVYSLYRLLPHRGQNTLLLVASYFFYGWWDWRFLSLILLSTSVDFIAGRIIGNAEPGQRRRRVALCISVTTDLTVLGFFKYFNFFAENLAGLLQHLGVAASIHHLQIILPVGISFYTFQTMSYTLDIYRGQLRPTRNFLDFATFVAFFPQLVAGPIERAAHLLPQIVNSRTVPALELKAASG